MALAPAEAGGMWVGSKGGLQHLGSGGFTRVGEAEGIRSEAKAVATDRAGGLWVATAQNGLFYCKGGRCEPVEGPPGQRPLYAYCLLVDTEGALWVSVGNGMVLRRQAGEWTVFNETHGLPFSNVCGLAQGAPGEIWAASSDEGLYAFRAGRFHAVPGTEAAVRSMRMSRDGLIWVGTLARGLFRLTTARLREYPVGQENHRVQVNGLVEEPPGEFWVSTYGGGLHHGSLDRLERAESLGALLEYPYLTAGLRMSDGALYFAGAGLLVRREPITGEVRRMTPTKTLWALCEGADGALWLGTREGQLLRLVDNTLQTPANGAFPALISGLVRGLGSSLWVATSGAGLFRWEAGQVQRWTTREGLPTDVVRALHQDTEGTLWIGTAGGGLAWLEAGRMHSVNSRQGLGDDFISQILEDDQGNLWLGCNLGILRVSKRELQDVAAGRASAIHPLALGEADGMSVAECSDGFSPAGLRSQSGTLYFTTLLGVVAVDPTRIGPLADPPSVLIEEVMLDGKPLALRGGALSVPPGPRELEIHYTAFNYAKPEHIRFRRRLEHRDEEWAEVGKARSIRYSRLRPGDYEFQVSAANQDGRWNETGASLAFTVQPFFWQTAWFRVVGALGIMASGGGLVWSLVRARLRRALEWERLALELRESQERMKLAAQAAGVGVWKWRIANNEVWGSEEYLRLFGFAPGDAVDSEKVIQRIHPDDRERVEREVERTLRDHVVYAGEFRVVLPDGTLRWMSARGQAEFGGDGKPVLMRGAALDITERKRAEHDMLQKQRELAHLSRATLLGELGGSLAHELNQPLTAMVNNAAAGRRFIAKGRADLGKLDGLFEEVVAEGRRAGEILRGIRDMIRKGDEERRPLDLNTAAAEILRLVRADALGRHCTLVPEFDPALGPVKGNPVQLQQVFLNLILNALDAMDQMPPQTRRVLVRTERLADGQVRASVRDFGGGLPPKGAEEVFKPFFSMKRNGMGLGLAIARSIIEAHGGRIAAANAEGGGACFSFWLPALPQGGATGTASPQHEGEPAA